jgi:hypothetical protein
MSDERRCSRARLRRVLAAVLVAASAACGGVRGDDAPGAPAETTNERGEAAPRRPAPLHRVRLFHDGTVLALSGQFEFGTANEVRQVLKTAPRVRAIYFNSIGGRVGEARMLRSLIKRRALVTYAGSRCYSACTIAFLAGAERVVAPWAKLGFHRARAPFDIPAIAERINDEERQRLIDDGVDAWFAEKAYATPNTTMWSPTHDELRRAHVITRVATWSEFIGAHGKHGDDLD